jgi:DNA-directed RNA polymerase subunit RPC12/RpoP
MVSRRSAHPGPRLGEIEDAAGLLIRCERCMALGLMPMFRARHLWGVRTRLRQVATDIRCSKCSSREIDVSIELRRLKIVGK